jgi:uncharacterized repeat protein (TIGR03803 family)
VKSKARIITLCLSVLVAINLAAQTETETILHSFAANGTDGYSPAAGLVFDATGNLYGTTNLGGTVGGGTIYELAAGTWTETILKNLSTTSGPENPESSLIFDVSGNLYGTSYGGGNGTVDGTVYELEHGPNGTTQVKILSSFNGGLNVPAHPTSGVIFNQYGWLIGVSATGGHYNEGSLYQLSPNGLGGWHLANLHNFGVGRDGVNPVGMLAMDSAGNFYGATARGGVANKGTIFEYNTVTLRETAIWNFNGGNGATPAAGVIFDALGNLYGTTASGGAAGKGNVFELSPAGGGVWTQTILVAFDGSNGQAPGALTFDASGNLYGITTLGGANGAGTVFKLSPGSPWTLTTLHSFGGSGDGATPGGSVILDSAGNVYGTTSAGGANGVGTVWEVAP